VGNDKKTKKGWQNAKLFLTWKVIEDNLNPLILGKIMQTRFDLAQSDIPKSWYNLLTDFPEPLPPPLHPGTKQPIPPEALEAIFPRNLIAQEVSSERWVEVPGPVRDIYALWRPTPLLRAVRLEKALQTPAHIYYKY
jgi:tryptophan synthase beta chain